MHKLTIREHSSKI